jgi:hypothetical protein
MPKVQVLTKRISQAKGQFFSIAFVWKTMRSLSIFVFSSEKIRLSGLFAVLFFEEKKEKNHGRISCKSS